MARQAILPAAILSETAAQTLVGPSGIITETFASSATYANPQTYNSHITVNGADCIVQASYDGGADAYAVQSFYPGDGRQFVRIEVRATDPGIAADSTTRDRAEIQHPTKQTGEFWMACSFRVAAGSTLTGSFNQLLQIHATGDDGSDPTYGTDEASLSSIFALNILPTTETMRFVTRSSTVNPTTLASVTQINQDAGKLVRDVWYNLVARHKMGFANDGILQIWLNGAQVYSDTSRNYGYSDKVGPYVKYGVYRGHAPETVIVKYANMEVSTSSLLTRVTAPLSTDLSTIPSAPVITPSPKKRHVTHGLRL